MLTKLLKYELKSTARSFLPLYGALIAISIITALFYQLQERMQWLFGISTALLFGLMLGMMVFTLIVIIQRFYNNLLKDEGYLMFTLPVKTGSLINSKLIAAMIWTIASVLVAGISFIIFMFGVSSMHFAEVMHILREVLNNQLAPILEFIGTHIGLVIQIVITAFVGLATAILQIYAAMAIGQLPPFSKHKVGFAVLAYIVIYVAVQIMLTPFAFIMEPLNPNIYAITNLILFSNIILGVALYIATYFILKRKLNLD